MKSKIQIVPSGISLADNAWGGFYKGGTYFLTGERKSGRTLLAIQYARECALHKEVCLFFTTMRPRDLMISAASIDFDLQHYMDQNLIIVIRAAMPSAADQTKSNDDYLAEYLSDYAGLVEKYQPAKVVFDELTPFIEFDNVNSLKESFLQTIEKIEENNITSLYILSDPAAAHTKNLVNSLSSLATGTIYLQKEDYENGGIMTIVPNVGHTEGQFSANYFLEPNKGILSEYEAQPQIRAEKSKEAQIAEANEFESAAKYRTLSDIKLPERTQFFYNYYNFEEFSLMLENQIAVYRATGQKFSVVSLKLDEEAERQGLFSIEQLKNCVRLSTEKKDKISSFDNKVLVILTKINESSLNDLLSRIKANLPSNDTEYIQSVTKCISVYHVTIEDDIKNGEDIIRKLLNGERDKKGRLKLF